MMLSRSRKQRLAQPRPNEQNLPGKGHRTRESTRLNPGPMLEYSKSAEHLTFAEIGRMDGEEVVWSNG